MDIGQVHKIIANVEREYRQTVASAEVFENVLMQIHVGIRDQSFFFFFFFRRPSEE